MYVDDDGTQFHADPTGRHAYRAVNQGTWGNIVSSGPGQVRQFDAYVPDHDGIVSDTKRVSSIPPLRTPLSPTDNVASFLEFVGWVSCGLAIALGVGMYVQAADSVDPAGDRVLAFAIAGAGVIQSLLLVGFGRVVGYLSQTAAATKRSAELLAQAVDDQTRG